MSAPPSSPRTAPGQVSWPVIRTRVALVLVLLYAAVSSIGWLQEATEWPARASQDEISAYEHRFAALRAELPVRGVVGYLGHPEVTGPTPRDSNAAALLHFRRYLLAQYALAPALLVESTEPEFVVGNFDPGATPSAPDGLHLVRDFGDGVVLFRRSAP